MLTHNLFCLDSNFTPPHCGYNFPDHSIFYLSLKPWNFTKMLQSLSLFSLTWCTWRAWLWSAWVTSPSTGGRCSASRTWALWSGAAGARGTPRSALTPAAATPCSWTWPRPLPWCRDLRPTISRWEDKQNLTGFFCHLKIFFISANYKSEQLSGGDRLRIKGITILPIMISSYFIWFWFLSSERFKIKSRF